MLRLSLEFARASEAGDPFAARGGRQVYLLRSEGGAFESTELEWEEGWQSQLEALQKTRVDPKVVQEVGDRLGQLVAPLGWKALEQKILRASLEDRTTWIQLRSAAAELYALPWELLTLKSTGQHLGELPTVLLSYEWPDTRTTPAPDPPPTSGRILFAWSAAAGPVPAREHAAALKEAARSGNFPFSPAQDILTSATPESLVEKLSEARQQNNPFSVLHLLCHGTQRDGYYAMALNDPRTGEAIALDPARLRQLLSPFASTLRTVILCACQGGNIGILNNHLGSAAQTLHRAGIATVIASRFPFSVPGSVRFSNIFFQQLLVELASVEDSFRIARSALLKDSNAYDWASLQLYRRGDSETRPIVFRPYRGLLAFQAGHARFFFGRSQEQSRILEALSALRAWNRPRMLLVAGASGSGKSSVVLAGVVPSMLKESKESGHPLRLLHLRPGAHPLSALEEGLTEAGSVLLVIDQFEELFTHTSDPEERHRYAGKLWELAQGGRVDVLITIRVDYLGRCGELLLEPSGLRMDQIAFHEEHRVFLPQLGREGLLEAIREPALKVGLQFEAGLAERMLQEVVGEPGALPLLQYALDEVWLRRKENRMLQSAYDEMGGVIGALRNRAEQILDGLEPASQAEVRRLLVRLVAIGSEGMLDARQRLLMEEVKPSDPARALALEAGLAVLVEARLLVQGEESGKGMIEVAHEALIRRWPRLKDWVQEDRDMLAQLRELRGWVDQWRTFSTLLGGEQLAFAHLLKARYAAELGVEELALIARSDEAEEQRRQEEKARERARLEQLEKENRRNRIVILGGALAMVLVLALWGVAARQKAEAKEAQKSAENARKIADQATRNANDATLTALAAKAEDSTDALLLLREVRGWREEPGWLEAALKAMAEPMSTARFRSVGKVSLVKLSDDADWVFTDTPRGMPHLQGLDGVERSFTDMGRLSDADFAPDGHGILAGLKDVREDSVDQQKGLVVHWRFSNLSADPDLRLSTNVPPEHVGYAKGHLLATTPDHYYDWNEEGILVGEAQILNQGVVISPDGNRWVLVTGSSLHQRSSSQEISTWKLPESVGMVDLANDGQMLAVVAGKAWWWREGQAQMLPGSCGTVKALRFSAPLSNGEVRYIATGASDGTICIYDLQKTPLSPTLSPSPEMASLEVSDLIPPPERVPPIKDLRFSPLGLRLLAITEGGPAFLWRNDGHIAPPRIVGGDYHRADKGRFLDETHVVTVSQHGTTRVWNVAVPTFPTIVGLTHPIRQALLAPDGSSQILGILKMERSGGMGWTSKPAKPTPANSGAFLADIQLGAWSEDTRWLALAQQDGKLTILRFANGSLQEKQRELLVEGGINGLRWLGNTLLIERKSTPALRWEPGEMVEELEGAKVGGTYATSSNGFIARGDEGGLDLWTPTHVHIRLPTGATLLRFSRNGEWLAFADPKGNAGILDMGLPLKPALSLETTGFPINALAWSPDGHLALGGEGLAVLVFNPKRDHPEQSEVKLRHQKSVQQVEFLGNRAIVTVDAGEDVQVWDIVADRPPALKLKDAGTHVEVDPNGSHMLIQQGSMVRLYVLNPQTLYELMWSITDFCLTETDREGLLAETPAVSAKNNARCKAQVACNNYSKIPEKWRSCLINASCEKDPDPEGCASELKQQFQE